MRHWGLTLALLLVAVPAHAQVAYQAAASGSAKESSDADGVVTVGSINPGVGANSIMVAGVSFRQVSGTTDISSITYGGNNFTAIGSCSNVEQGGIAVGLYQLVGQTGTGTVTLNLTAAAGAFVGLGVAVFTGVDQTTPILDSDLSQGSATATSTPAVDGATDNMFVDVIGTRDSAARTPGGTQTTRLTQTEAGSMSLDMSTAPAASPNDTLDWSFSIVAFAHCVASLKAASGGGGTIQPGPVLLPLLGVGQ